MSTCYTKEENVEVWVVCPATQGFKEAKQPIPADGITYEQYSGAIEPV